MAFMGSKCFFINFDNEIINLKIPFALWDYAILLQILNVYKINKYFYKTLLISHFNVANDYETTNCCLKVSA